MSGSACGVGEARLPPAAPCGTARRSGRNSFSVKVVRAMEGVFREDAGGFVDRPPEGVVVTISDEGNTTELVESNVGKHVRYSGGSGGSRGSREGAGEDTRERHFEGQLDKYYDDVIARIRDAEAILIFGPGEEKGS